MKQLGLAYIEYEQDADENFPAGVNAAGNGWAGQLYWYTKSTGVYRCSGDTHNSSDTHNGAFISYSENQNLVRLPVKRLAEPAATVEAYEFSTFSCDPSTPETVSATGISAPQASTRHDSMTFALNFVMTDGHVNSLTPEQVSNGANAVPTRKGGYRVTFALK